MNIRRFAGLAGALFVLLAQHVAAQEIAPVKPDLSDPDVISMPPMDPYSLSYIPERPQGAMDIIDADGCARQGGKWTSEAEVSPIDSAISLRRVGCSVKGKAEGRWMYSVDHGKNVKFYAELNEKISLGYVWFVDGKKEGFEVFLNQPEDFTRALITYAGGILNGTSFRWNEMGALTSVHTYKDDFLDGKYEEYVECLPRMIGRFERGKPVGIWEFFSESGTISMRRDFDRKASREDLPNGGEDIDARWTEWHNAEGVKIVEGYSTYQVPEDVGKRVGYVQLYMAVGTPWLRILYDKDGRIDDKPTFDLCAHNGRQAKPSYLDYDHDAVYINCNGDDRETYRRIEFYRTGEVWKASDFRNNRPHGRTVEYHPSKDPATPYGPVLADYMMDDGNPSGTIQYFDRDGRPMGEPSVLTNGSGHFKSYWHNGKPSEEGDFYANQKMGVWRKWYDNGSLEFETEYKYGNRNGKEKQWYNNGVLAVESDFVNGYRDGSTNVYYTDGHIAQEYFYSGGAPIRTWNEYTHGGQLKSETKHGKPGELSDNRVYYSNGALQAEGKVASGFISYMKQGRWNYYLKGTKEKPGKQWYSVEYDFDEIVSAASQACADIHGEYKIDPENREIGCNVCAVNRQAPLTVKKMRANEWQWYSPSGALEKKGSIHLGHMNDKWEYYYPNGKPMLTGSYLIDRKIGSWTGYYENGNKKFSGEYDNGVESGLWATYHDKIGTVSSQGHFVNGKRDGAWVWKYPNGNVREEGSFVEGKETGTWTSYYENGQKEGSGEFVDGVREGKWTWWREDGKEWRSAEYVKGKEVKGKEK